MKNLFSAFGLGKKPEETGAVPAKAPQQENSPLRGRSSFSRLFTSRSTSPPSSSRKNNRIPLSQRADDGEDQDNGIDRPRLSIASLESQDEGPDRSSESLLANRQTDLPRPNPRWRGLSISLSPNGFRIPMRSVNSPRGATNKEEPSSNKDQPSQKQKTADVSLSTSEVAPPLISMQLPPTTFTCQIPSAKIRTGSFRGVTKITSNRQTEKPAQAENPASTHGAPSPLGQPPPISPSRRPSEWLRPASLRESIRSVGYNSLQKKTPETAGASVTPPETPIAGSKPRLSIRRVSISLSPSSLRTAMGSVRQRGNAWGDRFTKEGADGVKAVADPLSFGKDVPKRGVMRGRSMSLVFVGKMSSGGLLSPGSPLSTPPKSSRSPGSSLRKRLKQRAGGEEKARTRSYSPLDSTWERERRTTDGAGPRLSSLDVMAMSLTRESMWDGVGEKEGGGPSLLDTIPAWKRPELLKSLHERETEFVIMKGLRIFCGTWNVNAKKPDGSDPWWLCEWLCPKEADASEPGVKNENRSSTEKHEDGMEDMYAIGLQEVVDLNAVNVAIDHKSQKRSTVWEERVLSTLNLAALRGRHRASATPTSPVDKSPNGRFGGQANNGPARSTATPGATKTETTAIAPLEGVLRENNPIVCEKVADVNLDDDGERSGCGDDSYDTNEVNDTVNISFPAALAAEQSKSCSRLPASVSLLRQESGGAGNGSGGTGTGIGGNVLGGGEAVLLSTGILRQRPSFSSRKLSFRQGQQEEGKGSRKEDEEQQQQKYPEVIDHKAAFVLVAKEHLVGTWLAVFVRASMLEQISDIRTGSVSAGVMGVMGNKGGVAIRLRLSSSSLCFISSHLAAHRDNVKARNENYTKILREMIFSPLVAGDWCAHQQEQQQNRQSKSQLSRGSPANSPSQNRRRLSIAAIPFGSISPRSNPPPSHRITSSTCITAISPSSLGSPGPLDKNASSRVGQQLQPTQLHRKSPPHMGGIGHRSRRKSLSISWSPTLLQSYVGSSLPAESGCTPVGEEDILSLSSFLRQAKQKIEPATTTGGMTTPATGKFLSNRSRNAPIPTTEQTAFPPPGAMSVAGNDYQSPDRGENILLVLDNVSSPDSILRNLEGAPVRATDEVSTGIGLVVEGLSAGGGLRASRDFGTASRGGDGQGRASGGGEGQVGLGPMMVGGLPKNLDLKIRECSASEMNVDGSSSTDRPTIGKKTLSCVFDDPGGGEAVGVEGVEEGGGMPAQFLSLPDISTAETREQLGIQDHDAVFWLGDLNYRIESTIAALEVLDHALSREYLFLAENDQLNSAREAGDAFGGFQEGAINFPPTYKYTAGTDEYDTRTDKKFRAPAWCDRILFWTALENKGTEPRDEAGLGVGGVAQLGYRRSETPLTSDHRPVSASFRFGSKQIDKGLLKKVLMELIEEASKGAGDEPQVEIVEGGSTVNFEDIRYRVKKSRSVWILNSGRVPARFSFHSSLPVSSSTTRTGVGLTKDTGAAENAPDFFTKEEPERVGLGVGPTAQGPATGDKNGHRETTARESRASDHEESGAGNKWYSVSPDRGMLLPEDKLEIKFTALIEDPTARALAVWRMPSRLEDIIVLRIDHGSDRYISVAGIYTPSVYGSSLATMAEMSTSAGRDENCSPQGLEAGIDGFGLAHWERRSHEGGDKCSARGGGGKLEQRGARFEEAGVALPPQLRRLVDGLLQENRCQQPGLFVYKGVEQEVQGIREAIDSGADFPPHCTHSMIEALVTLLESLSPPVIPESACPPNPRVDETCNVGAMARELLSKLPGMHFKAFVYLVSAFSCLLEKGAEHGLTAEQLVLVQRSCLVPDARRPKKRLLGVLPEIVGSRPGCNNDNKASKNNVGGEEEGEGEALRGCDKGNTHRAKCSGDEDALDLILNHFLVNGL